VPVWDQELSTLEDIRLYMSGQVSFSTYRHCIDLKNSLTKKLPVITILETV
jgi:hypothetical protein